MKIKVKEKSFSEISALPPYKRKKPKRQRLFWRVLLRIASAPDLRATTAETEFPHIPDWFNWQRECVREELKNGTYALDTDVDIYVFSDGKCMYHIGAGHLSHSKGGFHLTDTRGELDYIHRPNAAYTLNADYNWYELGDAVSFGTNAITYYCLPQNAGDCVTKMRLATEGIWTLLQQEKQVSHK